MATFMQPMLPFLRPMAPPKPATIRHFLRFSTSTRTSSGLDRNLVASKTAPASYPPPSLKSLPRPLKSHSSHRTSQPTKVRNYPDRPKTPSEPIATPTLSDSEVALNLPYYVTRTAFNELPVYKLSKRGGNLHQTRVKKISGSIDALRNALRDELNVPEKECVINSLTNQVVIKGWHKERIDAFLAARKF